MKVALWSINFERRITSLEDWLALLEAQLTVASQQQVQLLVLPEYLSEHFLSIAPNGLSIEQEIPWMAQQSEQLLAPIQILSDRYQIAILAGTVPFAKQVGQSIEHVNRSYFFSPNHSLVHQDKLCLTPSEQEPNGWCLTPAKSIKIVQYLGVKIAILICLDIEMPALSVLLAPLDIDLILVPSMTSKPAGYYRVFGCAKARAIELQAAIAVVGPIGRAGDDIVNRTQFSSAAAVYQPCEESLGHRGVLNEREISQGQVLEPLENELLIADIDIEKIRNLRHGSAEVWPGGWIADHVLVIDRENSDT
jgi:predicted amidohydrolase